MAQQCQAHRVQLSEERVRLKAPMTRDEWIKAFNKLPSSAQDYLLDPKSGENEDLAQTALGYDNDAWERVMDTVWELFFKKLNLLEFQAQIKRIAGDRLPQDVEREVLKNVVLPLGDLLTWDIDMRLHELGVTASETQSVPRVSLRPVSYGAAVRRIASNAKLSILSEEAARRMRDVLISFLKGVRTKEQAIEVLQRPQAEGGSGLEISQAERYFQALEEFISTTQVMSEEEYATWYQEYQRAAQSGEDKDDELGDDSQGTDRSVEGTKSLSTVSTGLESLDQAIDSVMTEIGDIGIDQYMLKRLRNTVSTRLRDVRNAAQAKEILGRDTKVGGVGLAAEQVERISAIIEKIYSTTRQGIADEEHGRIQTTLEEQKKIIEQRKQRESQEHAKWYQDKVGVAKPEALAKQLIKPITQRVSNMDGVIAPVQLSGLTEELAKMDVMTFRRLSSTPEQAAEQIIRKLETLKQESFERWTEGVEAWRRSPLQQQYLRLVADSFREGKPVSELAEERRRAEPNAPSAAELGAIIALNSRIQL